MKNGRGHQGVAIIAKTPGNSGDLKKIMATLVVDLKAKRETPNVANAMCNATGKLLKIVEMEFKYGREKRRPKRLELIAAR